MINLKKYYVEMKHFVLFITFLLFISCSPSSYQVTKIQGGKTEVNQELTPIASYEDFIKPYREHINKNLDSVLAYAPITFDKSSGKWETAIGHLMATACFEKASWLLEKQHQKKVDVCLLNHGGIRSIIPKGAVSTRTAFEVMPFENSLVVVALKGKQLEDMVAFFIKERRAHPLAGLKITMNASHEVLRIEVNQKPLEKEATYYVATSDYLSGGGDNMLFFLENQGVYDLNYKIRNVVIDHFKAVDTLRVETTKNISIK